MTITDTRFADLPWTIVIMGASGDLTRRKLIPALFHLFRKGRLPARVNIIGMARTPFPHEAFRQQLRDTHEEMVKHPLEAVEWDAFAEKLWYFTGDAALPERDVDLKAFLEEIEHGPANRIYYLAVAPRLFGPIAGRLGALGMTQETEGWRRIVVEKPYGHDLASAQELDRALHAVCDESQIYRIDHYLGKETAQNLLFFRFANTIFEPVWNRNYISNVQITVLEEGDVGRRGAYYDQSGVVRDMFQNHLLQLLNLIAMEPPVSFNADGVRNEKIKVLSAIRPIQLADTVRGQYHGYRDAKGVAPDSLTPTYAALTLYVDNWRWRGVPFYLRSGKALAAKTSQIVIEFQGPPHCIFRSCGTMPNILSLCIQPDEGVHLAVQVKTPDEQELTETVDVDFHYREHFGPAELPDAYERLLLDVINGDAALFPRSDAIEVAWGLMDPVLQAWAQAPDDPPLEQYAPGTFGPAGADALLARNGHTWRVGCHCQCTEKRAR